MGRSFTPAFAIEYIVDNGFWTPGAWRTDQAGRPTDANLARHVAFMEASTQPGGCNEHLGATKILAAHIVRNRGERVQVAEFRA